MITFKYKIRIILQIKTLRQVKLAIFFLSGLVYSQYTDQINSNRPGYSVGAFSVGKGVVQFEGGINRKNLSHEGYNNSTSKGTALDLSVRWGFLSERLELNYQGSYMKDKLVSKLSSSNIEYKRKGFLQNFLGIKYLIYDPFKKEEKVNVYSWKANNSFKIKHLIPAVSITLGANFNLENENPYPFGDMFNILYNSVFYPLQESITEPFLTLGGTIATQSHFLGTWVFVTNFSYNRYLSDYPEKSYALTLTHAFHPLWSIFIENQGFFGERYKDFFISTGGAFLFSDDIQIDAGLSFNTKSTPGMFFFNTGVSYRLDFHKAFTSAEEIKAKETAKEEKELKKTLKKSTKEEKKRSRKAKRKK